MRVHCSVVVICCALAIGCGGSSVERPVSASIAPPVAAPAAHAVKPSKRVAVNTTSTSIDVSSTDSAFNVDSLNPVKMNPNGTSGGKFNPFAK